MFESIHQSIDLLKAKLTAIADREISVRTDNVLEEEILDSATIEKRRIDKIQKLESELALSRTEVGALLDKHSELEAVNHRLLRREAKSRRMQKCWNRVLAKNMKKAEQQDPPVVVLAVSRNTCGTQTPHLSNGKAQIAKEETRIRKLETQYRRLLNKHKHELARTVINNLEYE